jgi:hypothetical protein
MLRGVLEYGMVGINGSGKILNINRSAQLVCAVY